MSKELDEFVKRKTLILTQMKADSMQVLTMQESKDLVGMTFDACIDILQTGTVQIE